MLNIRVLVERNRPERALSYAETHRRDGWCKDDQKRITEVPIYVIVCVFTPVEYRKHGYSHRLLRQLHYLIAPSANIGKWPASWGAQPDFAALKQYLPTSEISYLTPSTQRGFYESCLIGPDEDKREGWVATTSENIMLTWEMKTSAPGPHQGMAVSNVCAAAGTGKEVPADEWDWTYVYRRDFSHMAPEIAKAHLVELQRTEVPSGQKVFRARPDSPGVLKYLDLRIVARSPVSRSMTAEDHPMGMRWFHRSIPSSHDAPPPEFTFTDPLFLFIDHGISETDLFLMMALNITSDFASYAIEGLIRHCKGADPPMKTLKTVCPPPAFREEVVGRGGILGDRRGKLYIPHETAYYGPPGTIGSLADNQAWTWS